jgi:hypothetical protein
MCAGRHQLGKGDEGDTAGAIDGAEANNLTRNDINVDTELCKMIEFELLYSFV